MNIGKLIRSRREDKNLSLEAVAAMADMSKEQLKRIERSQSIPRFDTALKIARALKCSILDISPNQSKLNSLISTDMDCP